MDELLQRYTDPASCPGALPARLKPIEIAKLAYPMMNRARSSSLRSFCARSSLASWNRPAP